MILLYVPGEPSTITAQQKGVNWKSRTIYTKVAIKAEARRITRNLHVLDPETKKFVPVKKKCTTPLLGPVQCSIKVRYALTQEQAKKYAAQLSNPNFEIRHGKRPDWDNISKLICDTITKLGYWADDGQVADANVHKRYGTQPGIYIALETVSETLGDSGQKP